ncbi:MAG: hypothetical protein GF398_03620 [Chitinivibrionales bacterium]|nr:hypothetical protein [Chitinivibrionales bacterium]
MFTRNEHCALRVRLTEHNVLYLNVPLVNHRDIAVKAIDVRGKVVERLAGTISDGWAALSLENLPNGAYVLDIRTASLQMRRTVLLAW